MSTATSALLHTRLLDLHRQLLAVVKTEYERGSGSVAHPGELLQLVIGHPAFAWLRPLSKLLVDLDDKDVVPDAAAARAATEALFREGLFHDSYLPLVQSDPALSVEHGEVMRIVKGLPEKLPHVSA